MLRRQLLQWLPASLPVAAWAQNAATAQLISKPIPSTGERIPVVGLGSWITFNVGDDAAARKSCAQVMARFFELGGRLIDSSPMYGSSQSVIGDGLQAMQAQARAFFADKAFSADKVWTSGDGAAQIEASQRLWRVARFDLMQVHNLLAWEKQLPLIEAMKQQGRLRYIGITTSEGRRHREMEQIMRSRPIDFVQLTYNPVDRQAEQRLLPLAAERGIAVLVNRPFQEGALLRRLQRHPLPAWAAETDCNCWAQLVLKFIVSHPAVSCAIPATSRSDHLRENMGAAQGRMPDPELRQRIANQIGGMV